MNEIASKRYSQSFFEAAADQGKLDKVFEELKALKRVIEDNQTFFEVLEYPFITLKEKYSIINEVFTKSFDATICDFLKVLIEKDRIYILNEIIDDFEELYYDYRNILKVNVKSAYELDEGYKIQLAGKLKEVLNKDVAIEVEVDPGMIGGLYIKIKDKVIDATVKGKLDRLKDKLLYDKTEVR